MSHRTRCVGCLRDPRYPSTTSCGVVWGIIRRSRCASKASQKLRPNALITFLFTDAAPMNSTYLWRSSPRPLPRQVASNAHALHIARLRSPRAASEGGSTFADSNPWRSFPLGLRSARASSEPRPGTRRIARARVLQARRRGHRNTRLLPCAHARAHAREAAQHRRPVDRSQGTGIS
jgi:hypothetical protein